MKILWLCNIPLPEYSDKIGIQKINGGGWLTGLKNDLSKNIDIELSICFPQSGIEKVINININNISYFGVPHKINNLIKRDYNIEKYFKNILNEIKPDIIHIWGTEFSHTHSMVNICEELKILEKVVISIQGLSSIIEKHYSADLPDKIIKRYTFRDLIKRDNISTQIKKFGKRGEFEIEALKKVKYVIGRTDWDKACSTQINSNLKYYFCNEILRDSFYENEWNYEKCEKYSIFISQGAYPIKGVHYVLEALSILIKDYPKIKLYIAGDDITKNKTFKEKLKISSYGKYIKEMIENFGLQENVTFTGNLDEKQMCERFLNAHVFVSPSVVENESNSLSEAKILGVPAIASFVGGVTSRIQNKSDGFFYQHNAIYMLVYYIKEIFENEKLCRSLSSCSKVNAKNIYNREVNVKNMINIYNEINTKGF